VTKLDQSLVEVLLAIAIGFSSLTFYFVRQSLQKLHDESVALKNSFDKFRDEISEKVKELEIQLAVFGRDLDHYSEEKRNER